MAKTRLTPLESCQKRIAKSGTIPKITRQKYRMKSIIPSVHRSFCLTLATAMGRLVFDTALRMVRRFQ